MPKRKKSTTVGEKERMNERERWFTPVREWSPARQECVCTGAIIMVSFVGAVLGLWYVATHPIPR